MMTWITNFLLAFNAIIGNELGNFNPGGGDAGPGGSDGGGNGTPNPNDGGSGKGEPTGGGADPDGGQQPTINYPEGLDKELHGNASFEAFINSEGNINYADLMKSYVHQKGLLGKDKIIVPNKDTTEDQWQEIHSKLGLPKRDEYKVDNKLPEGLEADDKMFAGLVDVAHKSGILPRQLQPIVDYFNAKMGESVSTSNAQYEAEIKEQVDSLKSEWGQGYDSNIKKADAALKNFADEAMIEALTKSGVLQDPNLTKLFAKIGEGLQEDNTFLDDAKRTYGMTPDEAKIKLHEFYKKETALGAAFLSKSHPDNSWAKKEFMKLQEIIHGNDKAGDLLNIGR